MKTVYLTIVSILLLFAATNANAAIMSSSCMVELQSTTWSDDVPLGMSCDTVRALKETRSAITVTIGTIATIAATEPVKAALSQSAIALSLNPATVTIASVTVIGIGGIYLFNYILDKSIDECATIDLNQRDERLRVQVKEELKRELMHDLRNDLGIEASPQTTFQARP